MFPFPRNFGVNEQMLIIIEGPDCARKSTLADDIFSRFAATRPNDTLTLLHRGPPKSHPLEEYVVPLLKYKPGRQNHIICDRWHWGETVYPHVLNRMTEMTIGLSNFIELFLMSRGAVTVFMDPGRDAINECLKQRGDTLIDASMVPKIRALFSLRCNESLTAIHPHTYTPDSIIANAINADRRAAEE